MTASPDHRLAALRALASSALDCDHLGAPIDNGQAFIDAASPELIIEILDALAAAEGEHNASEEERRVLRRALTNHEDTLTKCRAQRDVLAARLAGAERALTDAYRAKDDAWDEIERLRPALTELVATVRGECPSILNENSGGSAVLIGLISDAMRPSEAGGEGRGTV